MNSNGDGWPSGFARLGRFASLVYRSVFFFASGFKFKIGLLVLVFPLVASVMVPGWMPLVALSWLLNALGCNSQLAAGSPGLLGTSSMSSIDEFTRKGG